MQMISKNSSHRLTIFIDKSIVTLIDIIKFLGSPSLARVIEVVLESLYGFLSAICSTS